MMNTLLITCLLSLLRRADTDALQTDRRSAQIAPQFKCSQKGIFELLGDRSQQELVRTCVLSYLDNGAVYTQPLYSPPRMSAAGGSS